MDIIELLDFLEIESPEEFSNFEDFAALIECDEMISYEAFYEILSKVSSEDLIEIINGYFEDVTDQFPDDGLELFTIMNSVSKMLVGILETQVDEEAQRGRTIFADEFYRFKNFYTFGPAVHASGITTGEEQDFTICEAIYAYRLEKLGGEKYRYDFSDCQEYEIEEYAMGISAPIDLSDENNYDRSRDDDFDDSPDGKNEYLIDGDNPVIDGEYSDMGEDYS